MISTAVIFAAGAGDRFGGQKQFAQLGSERVIDRVVRSATATCDRVVLVLPADHVWTGATVDSVVVGGASHGESVRNGMAAVQDDTNIVVLATASHPLASVALYERVIEAVVAGADAATPSGHLPDAIKRRRGDVIIETVPKSELAVAQAPSAFALGPLRQALAGGKDAPEELQLVEEAGGKVIFVDGEDTNLHITTPLELEMANALLPLVEPAAEAAS